MFSMTINLSVYRIVSFFNCYWRLLQHSRMFHQFVELLPLKVFLSLIVVYIVNYVISNYKRFQYWKSIGIPESINSWSLVVNLMLHYIFPFFCFNSTTVVMAIT